QCDRPGSRLDFGFSRLRSDVDRHSGAVTNLLGLLIQVGEKRLVKLGKNRIGLFYTTAAMENLVGRHRNEQQLPLPIGTLHHSGEASAFIGSQNDLKAFERVESFPDNIIK